jgi:hypothetical protein
VLPEQENFVEINRRALLKAVSTSGLVAAGVAVAEGWLKPLLAQTAAAPISTKRGEMLYRTLGRTNEKVSLIGLGGHHIGRPPSEQDGIRLIHAAIDRGINFITTVVVKSAWAKHFRMATATRFS